MGMVNASNPLRFVGVGTRPRGDGDGGIWRGVVLRPRWSRSAARLLCGRVCVKILSIRMKTVVLKCKKTNNFATGLAGRG